MNELRVLAALTLAMLVGMVVAWQVEDNARVKASEARVKASEAREQASEANNELERAKRERWRAFLEDAPNIDEWDAYVDKRQAYVDELERERNELRSELEEHEARASSSSTAVEWLITLAVVLGMLAIMSLLSVVRKHDDVLASLESERDEEHAT